MEISTAFQVVIGIVIISFLLLAAYVIIRSSMESNTAVYECVRADYEAKSVSGGVECGFNALGQRVYCSSGDYCMDDVTKTCCPTSEKGDGTPPSWYVKVIGDVCCNATVT